jgi:hypothetical protein
MDEHVAMTPPGVPPMLTAEDVETTLPLRGRATPPHGLRLN